MSLSSTLLTADDLDQFPDDGKRREIIGGELYVSPAPARDHQLLVKRILRLLAREIDDLGLGEVFTGPVDVRFSLDDQVQPDVVALSNARLDSYRGHVIHGAPDIVVEVLSPSSASYDTLEKRRLYERHRVPEYWIVDPKLETLTILRLTDGAYKESEPVNELLRSSAISDFTFDPAALFAKVKGQ